MCTEINKTDHRVLKDLLTSINTPKLENTTLPTGMDWRDSTVTRLSPCVLNYKAHPAIKAPLSN
jgi:hypothetical protein